MGGRLDATNVIKTPKASIITRISHDHAEFLGATLEKIAAEKAGIMRAAIPVIIGPQEHDGVKKTFRDKAHAINAPLFMHGEAWDYTRHEDGTFTFNTDDIQFKLPAPSLLGVHQYANATTAIAALHFSNALPLSSEKMAAGLKNAQWPARLQRLREGPIFKKLNAASECWLDGGHNDSAGAALAVQAQDWQDKDPRPLYVICGMMKGKNINEFLRPMAPFIAGLAAIEIPNETKSYTPDDIAQVAQSLRIPLLKTCHNLDEAAEWIQDIAPAKARILITGSLYLAGYVLQNHR